MATMLLAVGGALAATDPFGLWRSPNPDSATYRADPTHRVRTPTLQNVHCQPAGAREFRCGAHLRGRPYVSSGPLTVPAANLFSRASIVRSLARARARGKITPQAAQRISTDLAAVPESFFTVMAQLGRYGTYGGGGNVTRSGKQLAPPPGAPFFMACQPAGALLSCQHLNGDQSAPVGSGVYQAQQTADWRLAPAHLRAAARARSFPFTAGEIRLLKDLLTSGSSQSSSSSSGSAG